MVCFTSFQLHFKKQKKEKKNAAEERNWRSSTGCIEPSHQKCMHAHCTLHTSYWLYVYHINVAMSIMEQLYIISIAIIRRNNNYE